MAVSQLRPISAQGDLVSRRADPPSQDRRSLGYLVSSPPIATDHESRLHHWLETLPPAYSLRQTDPAVAADMGPRPGRSPPERDTS